MPQDSWQGKLGGWLSGDSRRRKGGQLGSESSQVSAASQTPRLDESDVKEQKYNAKTHNHRKCQCRDQRSRRWSVEGSECAKRKERDEYGVWWLENDGYPRVGGLLREMGRGEVSREGKGGQLYKPKVAASVWREVNDPALVRPRQDDRKLAKRR